MIKKLLLPILFLILISSSLMPFSQKAQASGAWQCTMDVYDEGGAKLPNDTATTENRALKLVIHTGGNGKSGQFVVGLKNTGDFFNSQGFITSKTVTENNGDIDVDYFDAAGHAADPKNSNLPPFNASNYDIRIYDSNVISNFFNWLNLGDGHCNLMTLQVNKSTSLGSKLCSFDFKDKNYTVPQDSTDPKFDPTKYFAPGDTLNVVVNTCAPENPNNPLCKLSQDQSAGQVFQVNIKDKDSHTLSTNLYNAFNLKNGIDIGPLTGGNYLLDIKVPLSNFLPLTDAIANPNVYNGSIECSKQFKIDIDGGGVGCSSDNDCLGDPNGRYCLPDQSGSLSCQEPKNGLAINPCVTKGNDYVCQTAIGAIGTSASGFAQGVLQLFLGLAGLILLFTIILNGYKFMTSQGDPEKVKEARESITAAIAGLLVIIFAIVILQLITIDLLHLPGFKP